MVRNKKVTGTSKSIPVGICIGTAVALMTTVIGTLISAWLISKEKIGEESIGYCAMIILLISSMLGSYTAQEAVKHKRVIMCAAAAAGYYVSLLAITAMFFGGQYQGMGVTALVVAAGTGVIILSKLAGGESGRRKIKKYSYS